MWKLDKGHSSGTTTAGWVTAFDWSCPDLGNKSIHLVNTHATLSLNYRLLATYHEAHSAGKEDVLVGQTTLAAGGDARFQYKRQYQRLILQVTDGSGHATYEINFSGQGA